MVSQSESSLTFAELLRTFRERAGLSQESLAEKAGLTPNAIGALERGERRYPYPNTRRLLAEALGLDRSERDLLMHVGSRKRTVITEEEETSLDEPQPSESMPLRRPLTSLVGRTAEIDVVCQLLARADVRMLTLTGPGGVGKTRLALETVARGGLTGPGSLFEAVVLVDLAPIADASLLLSSIAQAVGLQDQGTLPLKQHLIAWLKPRRILLVLDNFEQVLQAAPEVLELLQNCPELKVLVTSREALQAPGEQIYPVPPLSAPKIDAAFASDALQGLHQNDAIQLFIQRAQAVRPDFLLTKENGLAVARICARLDGLPLAIELAAVHVLVFTPQALLSKLEKGLGMLKSHSLTLPLRQRTMLATMQWSYDLLDEDEQAMFRRLAVFSGGISLEAIGPVCSPGDDEEAILDRIEVLVRKNLLHAVFDEQREPRLRMLETIRAFGLDMLTQNGEEEAVEAAHAGYFLQLAQSARPHLFGHEQLEWLMRLDQEIYNLRGAIHFALARRDWTTAVGIDWALWRYWWVRGMHQEARQWMETVLNEADSVLSQVLRAQARLITGSMAWASGDLSSGLRDCQEAVDLCAGLHEPQVEAVSRLMLGCNRISSGQYAGTDQLFRESAHLFAQIGELWGAAFATSYPGIRQLASGAYAGAIEAFEAGLALARKADDPVSTHQILYNLGLAWMATGKPTMAARAFAEGLTLANRMNDISNQAFFMLSIAMLGADQYGSVSEAADAVRLLGAAETLQEVAGVPPFRYALIGEDYQQIIRRVRRTLGEVRYEEVLAEGRSLSVNFGRVLAFEIANRRNQAAA